VGYSRTAIFPLPPGIRAFCIKPTLLYLYGLHKGEVDAVAGAIRAVRRPNVYTGNGIQLVDEVVRIKQRKASK
jgi:large subunit ribosomal protein L6